MAFRVPPSTNGRPSNCVSCGVDALIADQRVCHDDELAHDGDDGDLRLFSCVAETLVKDREGEDENARLKKLLAESMLNEAALRDLLGKMYGPPRPRKCLGRMDGNSLRKCIRPLASGLLLQPGHDEIGSCVPK